MAQLSVSFVVRVPTPSRASLAPTYPRLLERGLPAKTSLQDARKPTTACFTPASPRCTNENGLQCRPFSNSRRDLRAVAFLEFLVAAAWAGIVAAYVFQRVAHWLLMSVTTVRAVYVAVLVVMVVVRMVMIVVAVWAMHVGLLVHRVTPELDRRGLSRRCGQYARYGGTKSRF